MRAPPDWWKKWKPLRWLAGFGVLFALGGAISPYFIEAEMKAPADAPPEAHFTVPQGQPVPMLDGFASYDSVEKTQAALVTAGYKPELRRDYKKRSRKYPPRDLDSLKVTGYNHLGVAGDLELVFFNDRLYLAIFDISKPGAYAEALSVAEPQLKRDRLGTAEREDGSRRVLTNVFFSAGEVGRAAGSRGFAMWQDLDLLKLRNQWEALYGLMTP